MKPTGKPFDALVSLLFDQIMLCSRTFLSMVLIAGTLVTSASADVSHPFQLELCGGERSLAPSDTVSIGSPHDVIQSLIRSNQSIKSLAQSAEAASRRSAYAGAFPDPTLMVTGQPMPVYTARGKQVVQIRAEQMIPYPGRLRLMREMADLEADLGREMVQVYAVNALLEAQLEVNEYHRIQATRSVVTAFSHRLAEYEGIALRKYEGGVGDPSSALKLQMEQFRLVQTLIKLDQEKQTARYAVEKLIQQPVRIEERTEKALWTPRESGYGQLDASQRADVKALETKATMNEIRGQLLDYYNRPDVGVSINWIGIVQSDMPVSSDGRDALALGVAVRIPLNQSANKAKKEEVELQRLAIESEHVSVIRSIESVYADQAARIESDMESLVHLESSLLPAVQALLTTSISAYSNGKGDLLDLLDAERSRFQLEKERVDIRARIDAGNLILKRISGELSTIVSTLL